MFIIVWIDELSDAAQTCSVMGYCRAEHHHHHHHQRRDYRGVYSPRTTRTCYKVKNETAKQMIDCSIRSAGRMQKFAVRLMSVLLASAYIRLHRRRVDFSKCLCGAVYQKSQSAGWVGSFPFPSLPSPTLLPYPFIYSPLSLPFHLFSRPR